MSREYRQGIYPHRVFSYDDQIFQSYLEVVRYKDLKDMLVEGKINDLRVGGLIEVVPATKFEPVYLRIPFIYYDLERKETVYEVMHNESSFYKKMIYAFRSLLWVQKGIEIEYIPYRSQSNKKPREKFEKLKSEVKQIVI